MQAMTPSELFARGGRGEFSELYHIPAVPPGPLSTLRTPLIPESVDSSTTPPAAFASQFTAALYPDDSTVLPTASQHRYHISTSQNYSQSRGPSEADVEHGWNLDPPRHPLDTGANAGRSRMRKGGKRMRGMRVCMTTGKVVDTSDGEEGWVDIDPKLVPVRGGALDVGDDGAVQDDGGHIHGNGGSRPTRKGKRRGKGKAWVDLDYERHVSGVPEFSSALPKCASSVEAWVTHSTPLLQEYADRQICPLLGKRVDVQLNEPSQFVMGALQMFSSSNQATENDAADPSRKLPPQLLDGFVDIHRWAKEYFRVRFRQEVVGDHVPVLLTIITNNFYEAHMRLVDRIVVRAMENLDTRKGATLEVEDFAFGFDLHMAQEMPFFIEVNHRVRDTLEACRPKSPISLPPEPPITRYGRQTKPTKQAKLFGEQQHEKKLKAQRKKKAVPVGSVSSPKDAQIVPPPETSVPAGTVTARGRARRQRRGRGRGRTTINHADEVAGSKEPEEGSQTKPGPEPESRPELEPKAHTFPPQPGQGDVPRGDLPSSIPAPSSAEIPFCQDLQSTSPTTVVVEADFPSIQPSNQPISSVSHVGGVFAAGGTSLKERQANNIPGACTPFQDALLAPTSRIPRHDAPHAPSNPNHHLLVDVSPRRASVSYASSSAQAIPTRRYSLRTMGSASASFPAIPNCAPEVRLLRPTQPCNADTTPGVLLTPSHSDIPERTSSTPRAAPIIASVPTIHPTPKTSSSEWRTGSSAQPKKTTQTRSSSHIFDGDLNARVMFHTGTLQDSYDDTMELEKPRPKKRKLKE